MGTDIRAAIWRDLARQAAEAAANLGDPGLRASMLLIAAEYEVLARHAEATATDSVPRPVNRYLPEKTK